MRVCSLVVVGLVAGFLSFGNVFAAGSIRQTQESVVQEVTQYGRTKIGDNGIVTDFHSDITLDKKGNAAIVETITVYFPYQKHGIYRWIPNEVIISGTNQRLKQPIKINSVSYVQLPNAAEKVLSEEGIHSYTSSTSSGNYTVLKIGDANSYVYGAYQYTISYTMKNAVRFQDGYQELYLNITGDQWELPIIKASATVIPAEGGLDTRCYTGATGSIEANCVISKNGTKYSSQTTTAATVAASGLTIAIKYADNTFAPPSLIDKIIAVILPLLPLFIPVFAFMYGFSLWKKFGKDTRMIAIPPIFVPTKEMEAENLTILNSLLAMKGTPVSTLAEIIRIAERGLLTISYLNGDVSLKLNSEQQTALKTYLETQPNSLKITIETLTENYSEETSIKKLKNVYTDIERATQFAAKEFKAAPYITDTSEVMQSKLSIYSGISFVSAVALFILISKTDNAAFVVLAISLLLTGGIFATFAFGMLKRTPAGDSLYRDLLGLKKYIKTAEVKRLEFFNNPKKMIAHFEQILPYAVILGLDKQWAKEFGPVLEQLKYQPTWMTSNIPIYNALPRVYAGMSSQMSSSMAKISTPPQSSGSSFGGGGGFSGGGSGGGGGGSW